jgi:beta-lactamase regulating signal transducer with metallopeptidase domain
MIAVTPAVHPFLVQVGVTLAHFVWQGAAIALILAALLSLLRRRSAGQRYACCGAALLLMSLCPLLTMVYVRSAPLAILSLQRPTIAAPLPSEDEPTVSTAPEYGPMALEPGNPERAEPVSAILAPGAASPGGIGVGTAAGAVSSAAPASSDRSPDASGRPFPWLALGFSLVALAWSLGVVVLAGRLMLGWASLYRLRRTAEALEPRIEAAVQRLRRRLGLSSEVGVMATRSASEPIGFGLLRPVVLVPVSLVTSCPPELVEAWIAHELAHIRRYDLWVNVLQRIVETLLFYHPAVWWVSRQMRLERELCCDDLAVAVTGRRPEYAEALVAAARATRPTRAPVLAAGAFGGDTSVVQRVRRVLELPQPPQQGRLWPAGPLSVLLAGALLLAAHVHGTSRIELGDTDEAVLSTSTTDVASEAPTQASNSEAAAPAAATEPQQTSLIDTAALDRRSAEYRAKVEEQRAKVEEQRAIVLPAAEVARAFYAFRDALYDRNMEELRRRFKPEGKQAGDEEIQRLLDDLRVIGIQESRYKPWRVVHMYLPADRNAALTECWTFAIEREGKEWEMQVWCRLVPDREVGWAASRLSVVPQYDDEHVWDPFCNELAQSMPVGAETSVRSIYFNGGHPEGHKVYRVKRVATVDEASETGTTTGAKQFEVSGGGPVTWFEPELRNWQCLPPQREPKPTRRSRRQQPPPPAQASGSEAAAPATATEPQHTSVIDTAALDRRSAEYQAKVEEQRAMALAAAEVGRALYAFRDALYDRNMEELRRRFKPEGKQASDEEIQRLPDDLRVLGIDKNRYEPWRVAYVYLPADKSTALTACREFTIAREGKEWEMQVWCRLVPHREVGWAVSRLSVVPQSDDEHVWDPFCNELARSTTAGGVTQVRCVSFSSGGRPHGYSVYRVKNTATADDARETGATVEARQFDVSGGGSTTWFEPAVGGWQCLPPQGEPGRTRRSRRRQPPPPAQATRPASQPPELPSVEPPRTSVIQGEFGKLRERLAEERATLKRQRAILMSAVEAGRAVHTFRDALYDRDMKELRQRFRPAGEAASDSQARQLLDDLRTLGIDDDRYSAWAVYDVFVADRAAALVSCSSFEVTRERGQWNMQLWCHLAPDDDVGWAVKRLSVAPEGDGRYVTERFFTELCQTLPAGRPTTVFEVGFYAYSKAVNYAVSELRCEQATDPLAETALTASLKRIKRGPSGRVRFDDSLRAWQCFEAPP